MSLTRKQYLEFARKKGRQMQGSDICRLANLMEEMGEALQIVGKILIFGMEQYHPEREDSNNRVELEKELGHVQVAIEIMAHAGDLNRGHIRDAAVQKRADLMGERTRGE